MPPFAKVAFSFAKIIKILISAIIFHGFFSLQTKISVFLLHLVFPVGSFLAVFSFLAC